MNALDQIVAPGIGTSSTPFVGLGVNTRKIDTARMSERVKQSLLALEGLLENYRVPKFKSVVTDPTLRESSVQVDAESLSTPSPVTIFRHLVARDLRTAIIHLWEGRVLAVNNADRSMQVLLKSKVGNIDDHTAEIDLEWVAPQDEDLVTPGAVFYWTIFKETKRGSISNSQELRFRRLPSWSKSEIQNIETMAVRLVERLQTRPLSAE